MGRHLRALDPAWGPVERFACELRALRAAAGEPAFWKMARHCEVSKSALAGAVAGYALPSDRVAHAFVRVCGGDWEWWSERLHQARAQVEAEIDAPSAGEPAQQAGSALVLARGAPPARAMARDPRDTRAAYSFSFLASAQPGGKRGAGKKRWPAVLVALQTVALIAAVLFAVTGRSGDVGPDPRLTASGTPRPVLDGTDPYMDGCGPDEQAVDREGMTWPGSGQVVYGWLTMFHSHHCDASWGSVSGPNSTQWTVVIVAHREPDGVNAPSSFSGNSARPGSWGNLLSTATGCVWVEAYIQDSTGISRAAKTDCYEETGPLTHTSTPPSETAIPSATLRIAAVTGSRRVRRGGWSAPGSPGSPPGTR